MQHADRTAQADPSAYQQAAADLENTIDEVEKFVLDLRARLEPVLNDTAVRGVAPVERSPEAHSPLVANLRMGCEKLHAIVRIVRDIHERLEL